MATPREGEEYEGRDDPVESGALDDAAERPELRPPLRDEPVESGDLEKEETS